MIPDSPEFELMAHQNEARQWQLPYYLAPTTFAQSDMRT